MNLKNCTFAILTLGLSLMTTTTTASPTIVFATANVTPGTVSSDSVRSFQLGNRSYELVRVSYYDGDGSCLGHKAKHALKVMDDIETTCAMSFANVSNAEKPILSYPAKNAETMLLREGNYFDCGRDQLRVDVVDKQDPAQSCALGYINANGKKWVNGAPAVESLTVAALAELAVVIVALFALL